MSLYKKTATELSEMLAQNQISAPELLEDVFSRIDSVEDKLQAYISQTRDLAVSQAAKTDKLRKKGENLSPIAGIPLAVSDNISVKGIPLTCASKMLGDYIPPFSATVMDELTYKCTVITGKTNLDEFAMGSTCENSYYKKTRNPKNLDFVPGGASGGSAAAVAAGEAIFAIGTDTGGSARIPAAFCGIVGLRPTYGAVSRHGLTALASSLDQISPMGRSVADVAMLLSAICGPDKMDATTAAREYPDFTETLGCGIKGKVIGIPDEYFGQNADAGVLKSVMEAIGVLEREGALIKQISLPSTEYALTAYHIISSAEASSNLARFDGVRFGYRAKKYGDVSEMIAKSRGEGFGDEVKRRIMMGTNALSTEFYDAYYKRAALHRRRIQEEFDDAFTACDFIASPTAPFTALKLGESLLNPQKAYETEIYTVANSLAGLPSISVPCGAVSKDVQVGLQITGRKFDEAGILQIAHRYETATGGPKALTDIIQ